MLAKHIRADLRKQGTCDWVCAIEGQLHVMLFRDAKDALDLRHKVVIGTLAVGHFHMMDLQTGTTLIKQTPMEYGRGKGGCIFGQGQ